MSTFVNKYAIEEFKSVKNDEVIVCVSSLQKDLFYLLEYDHTVKSYESLPFEMYLEGVDSCTPDCLIHYKNSKSAITQVISYRELRSDFDYYEKRFEELKKAASAMDLDFKVFSEKEIYNKSLSALKYLYDYAQEFNLQKIEQVCHSMTKDRVTLQELLDNLVDQDSVSYIYQSVRFGYLSMNVSMAPNSDAIIAKGQGAA